VSVGSETDETVTSPWKLGDSINSCPSWEGKSHSAIQEIPRLL